MRATIARRRWVRQASRYRSAMKLCLARALSMLALALGAALPGGCSTGATVTVLSYNIHHGEGTDEVFDLERIARIITASGADLVALQEVDVGTARAGGVDQAAELARLTGMRHVFGQAIPYRGGSYGDAILTRLPLSREIVWPLPALPQHEGRVAVGGIVELPGGSSLRFLGTHLDHTDGDEDRVSQAQALLALCFPAGDEPPTATLLVGDLNSEPDSEPMRLLLEHFVSAAPGGLPSYPSEAPVKAIDWVLLAPADAWQVVSIETLDEPVASDHAPVRAVLRYR